MTQTIRRAGYMRFERNRDAQGRMRGGTYVVSEVPAPSPAEPRTLQKTDRDERTTTTNRPTDTYAETELDRHRPSLWFPEWVPQEMHASATHFVAGLDTPAAQLVLDEWAGALAAGAIQRSPLGYLKTLATRYREGDMSLRYAVER